MTPLPTRLAHLAVLRLTGPDRVGLLQGQTSNDARRVTPTSAQLTSFNNPKGRCYAIAVLAAWDDIHLLIVERSIAELLAQKLRMYLLRSKATVEIDADLVVLGTPAVPPSDAATSAATGPDRTVWTAAVHDGALSVTLPDGRALTVAPRDRAEGLAAGVAAWRLADVAAGIPCVVAETVEHFVPLWLGLERLGAIDYKKGCYTGQEIVARSHYLGTVKQRLHRASAAGSATAGDKVYAGSDQAIGEVVSAAPDGATTAVLLVARSAAPGMALTVGAVAGPALAKLIAFE